MAIVLGIDPGSQVAGFGVIDQQGGEEVHLDHGVIRFSKGTSLPVRLNEMAQALDQLHAKFNFDVVVIEDIFLGVNPKSAFVLGHVRGVCLQKATAMSCDIYEYAARKVKKAVTGNGGASKEQVRAVVCQSLGVQGTTQLNDATDALAVALTHIRENQVGAIKHRVLGAEL